MEIVLNEAEIKLCTYIGKMRKSLSLKDKLKASGETTVEIEIDAVGAELAFCKLTNVYPTFFELGTQELTDDCVFLGMSIDVKHTVYKTGKLLITLNKKESLVHAYVLMIGTMPNYKYIGWLPKDLIFLDKNIQQFGSKRMYVFNQSDLIQHLPTISSK